MAWLWPSPILGILPPDIGAHFTHAPKRMSNSSRLATLGKTAGGPKPGLRVAAIRRNKGVVGMATKKGSFPLMHCMGLVLLFALSVGCVGAMDDGVNTGDDVTLAKGGSSTSSTPTVSFWQNGAPVTSLSM